jgi:hypothetical protein
MYQGEENNMLVFKNQIRYRGGGPVIGITINNCDEYLYFSKDYKRINMRTYVHERSGATSYKNFWSKFIYVYEIIEPQQQQQQRQDGPFEFY